MPSPNTAASVFAPALLPVKVKVWGPPPEITTLPVFVRFNAPLPDESIVLPPPLLVSVNRRFELEPVPVYFSVPPSSTRLAAAFVDWPISLAVPPSASVPTMSVPPLIVVAPVYVFAPPLSCKVPTSILASPPVPAAMPPYTSVKPAPFTSIFPPPALNVRPRFAFKVKLAFACKTPPELNVS